MNATSHACTPPLTHWGKGPINFNGLLPGLIKVSLDSKGTIYWDGKEISGTKLSDYLGRVQKMEPQPIVFLETQMGAPCETLDQLRSEMDRKLACDEYGPCFEGILSVWREMPMPPGTPPS